MPRKAIRQATLPMGVGDAKILGKDVVSDDYVAFLVRELKPSIGNH